MARKLHYGFEKKQREIKKRKKREEKAERKRLKKEAAERGVPVESAAETEGDQE
ncbi:MAG: hypothetical protein ACE5HV_17230 [Acidobacteriota bacterium]